MASQDQSLGKLSASNAATSSVEDMLTRTSESSYAAEVTSTLSLSNTGNSAATKNSITKTNKSDAFVSQEAKTLIAPITFEEEDDTSTEKVSKLNEQDKAALSSFTGVEISTDADLTSALEVSASKFKTLAAMSNAGLELDELEALDTSDLTDSKQSSILSKLSSAMPNLDGLDEAFSSTYSSPFNSILGLDGSPIAGIPSDADYSTVKSIADQLSKFCDGIDFTGKDWSYELSMYNALLWLLAKLGLSGLLSSAIACSEYFGVDGESILEDALDEVSVNGDIDTFSVISDALGPGVVDDFDDLFVTTSSNSIGTGDITDALETIELSDAVDFEAITTTSVPNTTYNAYSLEKISALGNNQTKSYILGDETMDLISALPFA